MQCCWENYTLNFCGIKSGSTESSAELPDCLHRSRIAFPIPTKDLSPCRSWGSIQSCSSGNPSEKRPISPHSSMSVANTQKASSSFMYS